MVRLSLLLVSTMLACLSSTVTAGNVEFEAKPNGEDQSISASWSDHNSIEYTCTFRYNCQGGTGEAWHIDLHNVGSNSAECFVGRSGASYLYFAHFSLTVTNTGKDQSTIVHEEIESSSGPLKHDEYGVSGNAVKSSEKFSNAVTKLSIGWMVEGHEDL